ncbi:MAG TPA: hypothetical protein PLW86_09685 [Rhodocyclaceae bacterium]|nr:hypothetical protein [Rhodocyclaceae bacterium]
MSRELFSTWSEFQRGVDIVLAAAEHRLCIYDPDLALLKLDNTERLPELQRILKNGRSGCISIAVRDSTHLRNHAPRLMALLTSYGHLMTIVEAPETLAHLRDSMLIADGSNALIRFDQDQARSKLLQDAPEEVTPYQTRFDEIWMESRHPVTPNTLGL